jgi:hypothetical protein
MAQSLPEQNPGLVHPRHEAASDEVLRLTWAVIDGVASDEDRHRLNELVNREYQARKEYVKAVRLDSDLSEVLNAMHPPRFSPRRPQLAKRILAPSITGSPLAAGDLAATG